MCSYDHEVSHESPGAAAMDLAPVEVVADEPSPVGARA